jgi:hypothetical protein
VGLDDRANGLLRFSLSFLRRWRIVKPRDNGPWATGATDAEWGPEIGTEVAYDANGEVKILDAGTSGSKTNPETLIRASASTLFDRQMGHDARVQ